MTHWQIIIKTIPKVFVLTFLWLAIPLTLSPLDPEKAITQYSIQSWNMAAGLPNNSIYAIQQTSDGYLWLGTQDGLVRFDGVTFEPITAQLMHGEIRALYEDHNLTLWIGTSNAGLYRYQNGVFFSYPIKKDQVPARISSIQEDSSGNLWIGSFAEGLTCFRNERFTFYTTRHGLPDNEINHIFKDHHGDLWITTKSSIVKMSSPGVFQIYATNSDLKGNKNASLYDTRTKNLWIATKGLVRFNHSNFKQYSINEGMLNPIVNCLALDRNNNLWLGTDGGGLSRKNQNGFSTLTKENGLADLFIYALYEDRENNLWVGTHNGGLQQLRDSLFTTYTSREGLLDDEVQCLLTLRSGNLLIGTKEGLCQLDNTNHRVNQKFTTENGLLNNVVLSLFETPSGALWIGTYGGLHRYQEGKLSTFTQVNGLSDNQIECILTDSSGITWVGTPKGLNRIKRSANPIGYDNITTFTQKDGLSSDMINFLYQDNTNQIVVGTDAGLNTFPLGHIGAMKQLAPFSRYYFHCVYQDSDSRFWFGTNSGLLYWQPKENKITPYTVQSGLIEDYIHSIQEDQQGYLWISGRNGVSRLLKKELLDFAAGRIPLVHPENYNEKDGMKSRWCNGATAKTRDGRFWFPTTAGVATIDPNHKNNSMPAVLLKKLIVDGEQVPLQLQGQFSTAPALRLGPGKKRLEFYFTGISFKNPQKIRFKLKLEGYDRDWVNMENKRSTTYTNLPPGSYTFRVTAANPGGVWSSQEASLSFSLLPYFYQTPWFYVATVLFLLCAVLFVHLLRVRNLKRREKELAALVTLRTRDLQERNTELQKAEQKIRLAKEQMEGKNLQLESQTAQLLEQAEKLKEMDRVKSRFFANISHEFRTPLTLIMGPLEQILAENPEPAQKKRILLMQHNSQRLLNLINQLLELSKFESGRVKLQVARQNIIPLLKGILANFEPLAEQQELDLLFQADVEDITLYLDTEKFEHIMGNLLINAIKFTPAGGKITVTARLVVDLDPMFPDGFLRLSISDTGPGISRERLPRIFDRFYQSDSAYEHQGKGAGIGLSLVKEMVQLHHGSIDVHSREGRGTEFIIHFPLGDTFFQPEEISTAPLLSSGRSLFPVDSDLAGEISTDQDINNTAEVVPQEIILVVDDSADVCRYIRSCLEPLYTVLEARDGEEGLAVALQHIPDLVISDIMMPRVDGLEFCRRLKEDIKTSHIPVILLTAKAAEENIIRGLETGADDYITKPFSTKILLARIKNLVELRRQRHLNLDREMTLQPVEIPVNPIDKQFMKELKAVIHKHLADPEFNVEQLAKELFLDRSTLYRKVLALTGETPLDFIHSYRLKRAAELLRKGTISVLEVALEVGFASASYFAKCYKKKFLRSPSEEKEGTREKV